ncbi:hypothetical protein [Hufsiella ginkgonis]|uniref:Uncharacterized protein n=1 Tax=Hufsiella ginkgonis TaxID=2695274 RepID=A0A7K1Y1B1_9SPHI|nr:hypothetical protein [Hufsiella ginkgonis]MXV16907.1 hypothetical protein [Hufsiella ginkgonis]
MRTKIDFSKPAATYNQVMLETYFEDDKKGKFQVLKGAWEYPDPELLFPNDQLLTPREHGNEN